MNGNVLRFQRLHKNVHGNLVYTRCGYFITTEPHNGHPYNIYFPFCSIHANQEHGDGFSYLIG